MSAEEGRKILGSLVTLVSELLEELVKSEHRDDIDVLEAREAVGVTKESYHCLYLTYRRVKSVACRDLAQSEPWFV